MIRGGTCGLSIFSLSGWWPVLVISNLPMGGSKEPFQGVWIKYMSHHVTKMYIIYHNIKHGLSLISCMAMLYIWLVIKARPQKNCQSTNSLKLVTGWVCVMIYARNTYYMCACLPQRAVLCQSRHVYFRSNLAFHHGFQLRAANVLSQKSPPS